MVVSNKAFHSWLEWAIIYFNFFLNLNAAGIVYMSARSIILKTANQ